MQTSILRVAVASKEGKAISDHFGHARLFHVYELDDHHCRLLEKRTVRHYCLGGSSDKSAMNEILDTIQDCSVVFVAKIGEGPREKLAARGIVAVDDYAWEEIEPALMTFVHEKFSAV